MDCKHVSVSLSKALYGELNRLQEWQVRRHLRHCTDCATEWRSLQQLHAMLSANDLLDPEAGIPSEPAVLLSRTPEAPAKRVFPLFAGMGLTTLSILAMLLLPRFHPAPSVAAQVSQAL